MTKRSYNFYLQKPWTGRRTRRKGTDLEKAEDVTLGATAMEDDKIKKGVKGPTPADKKKALFDAVRVGDEVKVDELIEAGVDVNEEDGRDSPLYFAAAHAHINIMRKLIKAGARLDQKSRLSEPPLMAAICRKCFCHRCFDPETETDADCSTHDNKELCAQVGKVVDELIKAGAALNACDDQGRTALSKAAKNKNLGLVRKLLRAGVDVNAGRNRFNPLVVTFCEHGVSCGESKAKELCSNAKLIAAELLDAGANVDASDEHGQTPLILAAMHGLSDMVIRLVKAGANVNAKDAVGRSPIYFSNRLRDFRMEQELLNAGAICGDLSAPGKKM